MNPAIIGADPNNALLYRARRNRNNSREILGARGIEYDAATEILALPCWIIRRHVVADNFITLATVN